MPQPRFQNRCAAQIVRRLAKAYPDATCSLDFHSPVELLVATILSAQWTDERVPLVTKNLFRKYPVGGRLGRCGKAELEQDIQSTGFFRNKAKRASRDCCRMLLERYQGKCRRSRGAGGNAGVGRKTANVVLGTAFGIASGVVVDTHVARISRRLGLSSQK